MKNLAVWIFFFGISFSAFAQEIQLPLPSVSTNPLVATLVLPDHLRPGQKLPLFLLF